MLIAIKRPFSSLGALIFLVFVVWELSNGVFSNRLKHQRDFDISVSQQDANLSSQTHYEVFSTSTKDHEYFLIDFGDHPSMNPNIIPHPVLDDTWIVVAQLVQNSHIFNELVCNAVFLNDTLKCIDRATILPIASTSGGNCEGDLDFLNLNEGPHDARVFYGPTVPYITFGSNSHFTCFGQWIQDFRILTEWQLQDLSNEDFVQSTELQRPMPYGNVEKNWFLFWDKNDEVYVHHDLRPHRVFAKLESDGSVVPDSELEAREEDERCMDRFMPNIGPRLESIHQASNSLKITMCKRDDRTCVSDDTNTFVFIMFQHKTYFNYHSVYEPYVMLFHQAAPFAVHAISTKPFWIHGRRSGRPNLQDGLGNGTSDTSSTSKDSEMFYVTSMSWKSREQRYHGFIDDVVFISFGIEDQKSAGIDIVVGDLLENLGTC